MAPLSSFLTLGAMTLAALYCSVHGCSAWMFGLLLLGAALCTGLVRAGRALWATTRHTQPPRTLVLQLVKRAS